ncbi:MAG: hypothetical protein QM758_15385 [Armatimonas sp.]
MGVLPCQFTEGVSAATLGLVGTETFDLIGLANGITPMMHAGHPSLRRDGSVIEQPVTLRIDTPIEVEYYLHGGILPYVLRQLIAKA